MSRKVLGLDIRSRRICAVLIKSSLRESRILGHRVVPINAGQEGKDGLAAALEIVRTDLGAADVDCAACVPAAMFSCRNLQVPFGNPQKIRMILPLELEAYLPHAAEDQLIDFTVVDNRPGDEPQTDVLVAAVERKRIDPFIGALSGAGFDPERLTVSGMPAAMCLGRRQTPDEHTLCADIGETFGAISVIAGERILLLRCFSLPDDPAARERAVGTHIRMMIGALHEKTEVPAAAVRFFLTGDGISGASVGNLARLLAVDLQTADLRSMLSLVPEDGNDGSWEPALMNGALALAIGQIEGLESLNFHRSQFPGRKLLSRYRESLMRTGALAAAVLVLLFASVLTQSYMLKRQAAGLDAQIAAVFKTTFPEVKSIVDPYQQMQGNLQELRKNTTAAGDTHAAFRSIDVLKNISEAIPEEIAVVFDRMVAGPETILISGTTAGFNAVDEIKGHLERIPGFKKVTISSANTDRSGKEINFQLKVDL